MELFLALHKKKSEKFNNSFIKRFLFEYENNDSSKF